MTKYDLIDRCAGCGCFISKGRTEKTGAVYCSYRCANKARSNKQY